MNYKEILQNILTNGKPKQPTRMGPDGKPIVVENGTIGTFCEIFRHDMNKGFPLTTLRKMPWRSLRVELEGFIKGITKKEWYQERNCKFWNEWANSQTVKEMLEELCGPSIEGFAGWDKNNSSHIKKIQEVCNDLGPIYGYQWRKFGEHYGEREENFRALEHEFVSSCNGLMYGYDQLQSIVDKLHNSPYDRRMICSAWNPNQEGMMALPPCHYSWGVVVYGDTLNLHWNQRSVDSSHGLPNNIASYALLMILLCEESGLKPGELVGKLEDCHLYNNTIESVKALLERDERLLPQVKIKRKPDGSFNIFDWTYDEVELIGYDPHPSVNMGEITV